MTELSAFSSSTEFYRTKFFFKHIPEALNLKLLRDSKPLKKLSTEIYRDRNARIRN